MRIGGSGSYSTTTFAAAARHTSCGFADDQRDDLAVIKHLLVREQNFVVPDRADIVQTGHIFGQQDRGDARHGARRRGVAPQNLARAHAANRPARLRASPAGWRDVVDVNRFAGDMFVRALVRGRIVR